MIENQKKTAAVLFSGGDAPGMNQFLRALVRLAARRGLGRVLGACDGYLGLARASRQHQEASLSSARSAESIATYRPGHERHDEDLVWLDGRSVDGLAHRGGIVLGSSRCPEFRDPLVRRQVIETLHGLDVGAVVVCGGEGSLAGAQCLASESDLQVVGVPASIDNDVPGTEMALGFDTAVNTIVECAARFNDTAASHHRIMVLEVMGRANGNLAVYSALACGAEMVITPERGSLTAAKMGGIAERVARLMTTDRRHAIVLITEGVPLETRDAGGTAATAMAAFLQRYFPQQPAPLNRIETRASVLGHLQRGGVPMAFDQILAAGFAAAAVEAIVATPAVSGIVGLRRGRATIRPFGEEAGDLATETLGHLYQLQKDISRHSVAAECNPIHPTAREMPDLAAGHARQLITLGEYQI